MSKPTHSAVGAGHRLGDRYELLNLLGQGGYGDVYKARQLALRQEVALKLLRPPPAADEHKLQKHLARFRRELRICSRLFHPNISRPIDYGETPEGQLYIVFTLIPGHTLAEVLAREGALAPKEAFHLMLQLLDALDCAHRHGVIHRDIKPQNIMITDTGARRNAVILDFGISKLAEEFRADEESRITSIFEMLGTPAYAAPEQLRGISSDARSDLYSWALVFLECLTGERVIQGNTLREVLSNQMGPEPIPLPAFLEGLRLGELLSQVSAKDIDQRAVTASELLDRLEACEREECARLTRHFAGAQALSAPPRPKRSAPSSPLSGGQLRHVTALCCRVTVSSPSAEFLDLEEQARLLRTQQERCIKLAEESGATLGGALGEQVLFFFGYPTAREDAPRSAARTALRLLDEASSESARLEGTQGMRLTLRLGMHTGLSLIPPLQTESPRELPYVLGTTPTISSQWQELAEPGELVVSPETCGLLQEDFLFERVLRPAPHTAHQIEVNCLRRERGAEPLPPRIPMVGRAEELELLLQRWAQIQQGAGQGILVTGEPGIGKSRLVRELRRALHDTPCYWLESRCIPELRAAPLRPIASMLEHLLGRCRDWSHKRCQRELVSFLSQHGLDLSEALPLFASLLSLPLEEAPPPLEDSSPWHKALTFNAVMDLLMEMAARKPVLLVLEDLQWADPTTLELLAFLLEGGATARLGLVLTTRSEKPPFSMSAQMLHLQLGRLERHTVEEMISALAGDRALPPEWVEQIASRTDGVPLFVEELTRVVLESEARREDSGQSRLTSALSALAIPGTLRGLLEASLDRLGQARETAELAALLGREFHYELLQAVSPREERSLEADLSILVASRILERVGRADAPAYTFRHALLREAARDSLPQATRSALHARIASVLQERFPEFVASHPELLAYHQSSARPRSEHS
jgi:TOMM system kinase/cyclase fusion protein